MKVYHQQGAQLNQKSLNNDFFRENNKYHQIGNGYLDFNITVRKNYTTNFHFDDPIRLLNNAFAFCFTEARLSTTIGSDIEHNKFCAQISTIMRVISNKDGDLLSQFDNINGNEIPISERFTDLPPQMLSTPHPKKLINNQTEANKSEKERIFVFRRYIWILQKFLKM